MKILVLSNHHITLARFRTELLQALCREGHEVHVSVPRHARNGEFEKIGCVIHENTLTRHGMNPLRELFQLGNYRRLVGKLRPDLVLTYTIKPNLYGSLVCRRLHIPIINTVTGAGSMLQHPGILKQLLLKALALATRQHSIIFFQNRANMELYRSFGITGRSCVLVPGSGVNLQRESFEPYPQDERPIRFIVVSRLRRDKGFDELFAAIRQLGKRQDLEFHLVGPYEEDRYRGILHALQEEGLPLVYHGEIGQDEVHDLVARCHCLVHPSHHEGMSNVLQEASATGRPCLASDIPGCREIVEDEVTGLTFAPRDPAALVQSIAKFVRLGHARQAEMGRKAREKMEREFDRQNVVQAYLDCIYRTTSHT